MKNLLSVTMIIVSCCTASSTATAASCKPDRDWVDIISKQRNIQWEYNLTKVGGLKGMLVKDEIAMFVIVARLGNVNVINLQLTKVENDRDRVGLDSRFRATKGDQIVFGMVNGAPLSFVATDVANSSQIQDAGLVMTAILSAHISDKDMATFREALTTKPIEAVRLFLRSGQVDRVIEDKNGIKMMDKFSCFYQFLDSNGISLTIGASAKGDLRASLAERDSAPAEGFAPFVPGKYVTKGSDGDYVEYASDRTFFAQRGGRGFAGTYQVQADTITMQMPNGQATRGRLKGNTVIDSDGLAWERMDEAQRTAAPPLPREPGVVSSQSRAASGLGRYVERGGSRYLELKADGTVACNIRAADGKPCGGTYRIQGELVSFKLNVGSWNLQLSNNSLIGKTQVWEREVDSPSAQVEPPRSATTATAPVTIQLGMTPQQVEDALKAKPQKIINLGGKRIYVYPDMKITFIDEKVTDVQ